MASINPSNQGDSVKILIVDDDPDILEAVSQGLDIPGISCELLTADTGLKGLQLAKLHQPRVVILDLQMADLNGFDLVKELQHDHALAGTKVLMLTALDTPKNLWQSVDLGIDDFLGKPFDLRELEARLLNLITV